MVWFAFWKTRLRCLNDTFKLIVFYVGDATQCFRTTEIITSFNSFKAIIRLWKISRDCCPETLKYNIGHINWHWWHTCHAAHIELWHEHVIKWRHARNSKHTHTHTHTHPHIHTHTRKTQVKWSRPYLVVSIGRFSLPTAGYSIKQHGKDAKRSQGTEKTVLECVWRMTKRSVSCCGYLWLMCF